MRRIWLAALFTVVCFPSYAQFLPDLQAKTPEEYDAYLAVIEDPAPEKCLEFEHAFPDSALRLPVLELLARDHRTKGDSAQAIAAIERGLAFAPDYLPLLVQLADLLANGPNRHDRAEQAARRALELLQFVKAPRRIAPNEWTAAVARLRAQAHGALGLVRFKRDDIPGAVNEFESALAEPGANDPAIHYRLGRLYALTGRSADARRHLEQAARRGEKLVRERATAALAELK